MSGFSGACTKPGLEVWRIENKEPAKVPELCAVCHRGRLSFLAIFSCEAEVSRSHGALALIAN